jgi:repressor LexA
MQKDKKILDKRLGWTMKKNTKKEGLTPKQKWVFEAIKDFIQQNGHSPSYEEIKQLMGVRSKSNVHAYVHRLATRGWIGFGNGRNRSIYIL